MYGHGCGIDKSDIGAVKSLYGALEPRYDDWEVQRRSHPIIYIIYNIHVHVYKLYISYIYILGIPRTVVKTLVLYVKINEIIYDII